MIVDDYPNVGWSSMRGGWTTPTPVACRNSSMNFGGSVPSLHHTGSMRSVRSLHSILQPPPAPETPRPCLRCQPPIHTSTPNNCSQQRQLPAQYYTPSHYTNRQNGAYVPYRGSASYHGDPRVRCDLGVELDENALANGNWVLGDLRSLHRCVPAIRRTGVDVSGMRTHFYPDGGWGWLVCAAGFLALLLTTGMQLAFGLLHLQAARHLGISHMMDIAWIGSLSAAVSQALAPLVVGACRRGSTRLTAVMGGLVLAVSALFTSFAVQIHQVLLSYGLVLGAGAGLVRETSSLVLGHYFRKKREFVEMVVQAGTGVGIALFSVSYKEAIGRMGWRLGLQSVTGVLFLAFFLGLIYKSASLYHPQRRTIVHMKSQQNKSKSKSKMTQQLSPPQPLIDLGPLGSRPVRMLMLAAGTASFGLYTPAFYIALQGHQEGLETSALVLLQTCLGLSTALGCVAWGIVISRPSAQCLVSRQYLCQAAFVGVGVSQVALGNVQGYNGLVLASGLYGASLGGSLYSLKMLALERLRAKQFAKSWALVQAAEALPILLGVPLTGYMNIQNPRVGYYVCTLSSLCGAAMLFLVGWGRRQSCTPAVGSVAGVGVGGGVGVSNMGSMASVSALPCGACTVTTPVTVHNTPRSLTRLPKSQSLHIRMDDLERAHYQQQAALHYGYGTQQQQPPPPQHHHQPYHFHDHQGAFNHGQAPLRPSKSVPEGLAQDLNVNVLQSSMRSSYRTPSRRPRDITVIEQITTSV